ncbi:MAG: hypothetical protein MJE12_00425, partial [Alphaproteobacteria bacterium]|nr:hypothetical protein [Alphaproteobacteria bacterium]
VLPTALANRYRRGLLSGDPALVVQEAGAIAELDRTDARLVSALPTDEVGRARAIDEFAALDLPPDRAVELGEQKAATAADDAIVDNDQTDTPFVGFDEGEDDEGLSGIQEDGSAVVVDPETGEERTVDRASAERVRSLANRHGALIRLRREFLDAFDRVESGEFTQAEATRRLLDRIDAALPSDNEQGAPVPGNLRLR